MIGEKGTTSSLGFEYALRAAWSVYKKLSMTGPVTLYF